MKTAIVLLPSWSVYNLPLGLASVASILKNNSQKVKVFDLNIKALSFYKNKYNNKWNHSHKLYWDDHSRSHLWEGWELGESAELDPEIMSLIDILIKPVLEGSFDLIGMSIFGSNRKSAYYAAKKFRQANPSVKLLFGGPSAEHIFWIKGKPGPALKYWLKDNDAAIIGEAENTLPDLLKWWENPTGHPPKGVVINQMGVPQYTPAPLCDFSNCIAPDCIDFDTELYTQGDIPVEISRGCVGNCAFCTEKNLYKGYRTRPVEQLIKIFKTGIYKKGIKNYSFVGPANNGNNKHFSELIYSIIREELDMKWDGSIRFDKQLDKEFLKNMAKSGCTIYNVGLESASPFVLKKMNKPINLELAKQIIKDSYEAGIKVSINLITGFPGELEAHHNETLKYFKEIVKYIHSVHISPCQIYEGSHLSLYPEKYNLNKNDSFPGDWKIESHNNTKQVRLKRVKDLVEIAHEAKVTWLAPFEENLKEREYVFYNEIKY